jgi:hypothetical protein
MTDSVNEEAFAEAWSFDTAKEYRCPQFRPNSFSRPVNG